MIVQFARYSRLFSSGKRLRDGRILPPTKPFPPAPKLARPRLGHFLSRISSTLSSNSSDYLETNLKNVVKWIEKNSEIELLAIGIGHDVTRYYDKALKIADVQDLGDAMINQLTELFSEKKNKKTIH